MGTGTQRGVQREDVLAAAYACFARNGARHTTMEDVARELRRSRPVVYRYFSDKQDLFRAVAGTLMDRALTQARDGAERAAAPGDKVLAVLEAKIGLAVRVHADSPHHARELLAEDTQTVAGEAAEYIQGLKNLIVGVLTPELGADAAAERAGILLALARGLEDDLSDRDAARASLRLAVDLVCVPAPSPRAGSTA